MLCAEAVFLQLNSDAEWQNRIYGKRKTHKQMASLHPSCPALAGNMPYFPKLLPNYCLGFQMRRAPSSKPNIYFTGNAEACSSELCILQMLTHWFWPSLSIEEPLEFKWAPVCSREKETNTNRLSNLLSPHLQSCPRAPCCASSKSSLRTRNKKAAAVFEEDEEESYQPTKVISLKIYIQGIWAHLGPTYRNWAMTNIICLSSSLAWFITCQITIIWGCNCLLIWAIQFCSETRETGLTLNPFKESIQYTSKINNMHNTQCNTAITVVIQILWLLYSVQMQKDGGFTRFLDAHLFQTYSFHTNIPLLRLTE